MWGPAVAYMALIFYQSSLAVAPLPSAISDKVAHFLGYGLLGALLVRATAGGFPRPVTRTAALVSIAIAVLYAASDEFHQRFVPGRTADLDDLGADALGAVAAAIIGWACGILWPRLAHRAPRREL